MSGNVDEWCWDWYGDYPEKLPKDFTGAVKGVGRVLRGGSWLKLQDNSRVSIRIRNDPNVRNLNNGFRLAQDL